VNMAPGPYSWFLGTCWNHILNDLYYEHIIIVNDNPRVVRMML